MSLRGAIRDHVKPQSIIKIVGPSIAALLLVLLAGCDFEESITPIPWPGDDPQPAFEELEEGLAEEPMEPVEDPAPPPEDGFEEIEASECQTTGELAYCVGVTLATSGGLNVRAGPSTLEAIKATLPCGATVTITSMPQALGNDGHLWAQVETNTGHSGWAAVDVLDESTPACTFGTAGKAYPGAGEKVELTELPFEANIYDLEFWWGFGNTTFAQENKCECYERTSGLHPGLDFALPYNTDLSWPGSEDGKGNNHLHFEVRPADNRQIVVNPLFFMGQDHQTELTDYFAGDYEEGDSPMELGYYALGLVPECLE